MPIRTFVGQAQRLDLVEGGTRAVSGLLQRLLNEGLIDHGMVLGLAEQELLVLFLETH